MSNRKKDFSTVGLDVLGINDSIEKEETEVKEKKKRSQNKDINKKHDVKEDIVRYTFSIKKDNLEYLEKLKKVKNKTLIDTLNEILDKEREKNGSKLDEIMKKIEDISKEFDN